MSKELADRMEKVASDLLRDGMLDNAESKIIDEAIAALRAEPAAACHHEPYQGRCIHCDIAFKNGKPLYAAPSRESQRETAESIAGSRSNSGTQSSDHPTDRYETLGYALAMRIMQSGMYDRLDDKERAECDELIRIGMAAPSREDCKPKEQK